MLLLENMLDLPSGLHFKTHFFDPSQTIKTSGEHTTWLLQPTDLAFGILTSPFSSFQQNRCIKCRIRSWPSASKNPLLWFIYLFIFILGEETHATSALLCFPPRCFCAHLGVEVLFPRAWKEFFLFLERDWNTLRVITERSGAMLSLFFASVCAAQRAPAAFEISHGWGLRSVVIHSCIGSK